MKSGSIFRKVTALLMALSMSMSLFKLPAFAAENSTTVTSEDGKTTTITTEITWGSPEGTEPVVEGEDVSSVTTIVDDDGNIIQESGSQTGHETTTETETNTETTVEDKETETTTEEGEPVITETQPGEWEETSSNSIEPTEPVDPILGGNGSDITVELKPGDENVKETVPVNMEALVEMHLPHENGTTQTDIVDPDTGEIIGQKTVTVADYNDEKGVVVGYTTTTTEKSETTTYTYDDPNPVAPPETHEKPQPQEPATDENGVTTEVTVEEVKDENGTVIGYKTTTTKKHSTEEDVTEIVLPEKPAEGTTTNAQTGETTVVKVTELRDASGAVTGYEVTTTTTDRAGNVHNAVETLYGRKNTNTLTSVTDITETTVTFTQVTGTTVTTTTEKTTEQTKRIVATDRTVTASMGNVTTGDKNGIFESTGVEVDVDEPDVGKTDQNTDLYNREDKELAEWNPDGYDFQWLGQYGLESAIRVNEDKWQAHQFVLVDKDGNEHYVYCADFDVSPQAGFHYDMENVEDADYYDSEAATHIRAIALNGYWGTAEGKTGSLEAVKKMMQEAIDKGDIQGISAKDVDSLTDGMALAATQAALWTFGNSGSEKIQDNPFQYYFDGKLFQTLDSQTQELTKALYNYLITLTEAPTDKNTLINENNFATSASLTVGQKDEESGKYEADLTFTLAVVPDVDSDDLLVLVVVDGVTVETRRLAGDDSETKYGSVTPNEDGTYTLSGLKLADGVKIDLQLKGTQNIGEGVYLFTSEVRTGPDDEDISSQTFVGIESGKQTVDLSVSLEFKVDEATATVVTENSSTTKQKVDTATTSRTDITTTTTGRKETTVTVKNVQNTERDWKITWLRNYSNSDTPKTGDDSGVWFLLLAASVAGLAVIGLMEILDKRRKTNN